MPLEHLLQWHAENRHENILFMVEKFFTIQEQYKNQNNKIYAQTSLEVCSEGAGRPSHFLRHGMLGVSHQGVTPLHFCEKGVNWCLSVSRECATSCETRSSSMIRNGSSSSTQLLPTRPRQLRSGCKGTYWPSSAPRIGPRRVQTSTPWTENRGLF